MKNIGKGQLRGMLCKKRGMDGYKIWMKRKTLYTNGVVGSKTTHMGYVIQEFYLK